MRAQGPEPIGLSSAVRLLRALLHRPRSEVDVRRACEAADISERTLIVAADALGVRTQRGQWWLPG